MVALLKAGLAIAGLFIGVAVGRDIAGAVLSRISATATAPSSPSA